MAVTNYHSVNGRILGETTAGVRTDYLTDALGSVTATVNASGAVVNRYRYKPYGALLSKTGVGADPKQQWVGSLGYRQTGKKYSDVYVRARHYETSNGRWTTKDPIGFRGGDINVYRAVMCRPTVLTDRLGLEPTPCPRCGPDLTSYISAAVAKSKQVFPTWPKSRKNASCDALLALESATVAWDILDLRQKQPWLHLVQSIPTCSRPDPPCKHTVQVGYGCTHVSSVNYVIYGTMMRLCYNWVLLSNWFLAADWNAGHMVNLIRAYKWSAGNREASVNWALYGWDGWPGPRRSDVLDEQLYDYNQCSRTCTFQYAGPPFSVTWLPGEPF